MYLPPRKTNSSIIVLPTSSGKTILFFSLMVMAINQTVIVVVPFVALINDLILRASEVRSSSGSGLVCEEWTHEGSITTLL